MLKLVKPIVLFLWILGCFYAFRWLMYWQWAFDIIDISSWQELEFIWDSGKVFPWIFVFELMIILPILFIGLSLLKKVNFELLLKKLFLLPLLLNKKRKLKAMAKKSIKIKKKKSYINKRPPPLKSVSGENFASNPRKHIEEREQKFQSSSLSGLSDNRDIDSFNPYEDRESRRDSMSFSDSDYSGSKNEDGDAPLLDFEDTDAKGILERAGYKVLSNVGDVDYVAISNTAVVLCFDENQQGDWLADEERFNDDEPLWFSESAQKVSPAYKALQVKEKYSSNILAVYPDISIVPVLILSKGNIINAVDMLDVWEEMQIFIGRIGEAGSSDIKKLSNLIPKNPDEDVNEEIVETIKNIIENKL